MVNQRNTGDYGCSLEELISLTDCSDKEELKRKIATEYGSIDGLCQKLKVSPTQGEILMENKISFNPL